MVSFAYDLVVVGGGPGGYPAALRAAHIGLRVALVEGGKVGGVCLHSGCIPTKAMLHVAKTRRTMRLAEDVGWNITVDGLDFSRAAHHRDDAVNRLYRGLQGSLRKAGVDVITGWATVESRDAVRVASPDSSVVHLESKSVILATGSSPRPLRDVAFDGKHIWSSDDAVRASALPQSVIIAGAGAIGVEFASLYVDLGVGSVHLVEMEPTILPLEDEDIGAEVSTQLERRGVSITTNARIDPGSVTTGASGVGCTVQTGGGTVRLDADVLLVAIGRLGNVSEEWASSLGIALSGGFVVVDGQQQTSAPGIYAVGDITGGLLLAHKATAEGLVAAGAVAGTNPPPINPLLIPRCTYGHPEVAAFGMTEAEARYAGHAVKVGRYMLSANARALVDGDQSGFVKFIADADTGEVLGFHAVGSGVTELVAGPLVAAAMEATMLEIGLPVYPHPTMSESIGEAAMSALRPTTHW